MIALRWRIRSINYVNLKDMSTSINLSRYLH